ncbi:redoxin domain-containing protein [Rubripirellula reticaptiva]|uniref:Thiol-disulfide oxidoreductase YkuV n=1 Tax=Rubripirellula reticaptiva TaxID=2528013 RepID=A0A5C6EWM8_9BACT|nr:redoxin domain-containing protein [Rubripirellula reticaptiva]TWU51869.1 Thiol-disulfide oxidoreductase YkuV [Rubripirellula reticaptiva]
MIRSSFGYRRVLPYVLGVLAALTPLLAIQHVLAAGESDLVPRYLLGLVHAPEVHRELDLTADQVVGLESLFQEIDPVWFPARNLPTDQRLVVVDELEGRVRDWFSENASDQQSQRLRQLEFYAQGSRILLRDDVAQELGIDAAQQAKIAEVAEASQAAQQKLAATKYGDESLAELRADVTKKVAAEQSVMNQVFRPEQRGKLSKMLGERYDPSRLSRIYAMAPNFGPSQEWINSSPLSMGKLRGKVVLVHFYAFQCHNCHANFDIYRRWAETYSDDEVVVIGIQTPETSRERDAGAVRAAAKEKGLTFPIQIDLDSKSWAAWGNTMWPTVYVVDKNGYIRHWWSGELNWKGATADKTIEQVVDKLLAEKV